MKSANFNTLCSHRQMRCLLSSSYKVNVLSSQRLDLLNGQACYKLHKDTNSVIYTTLVLNHAVLLNNSLK